MPPNRGKGEEEMKYFKIEEFACKHCGEVKMNIKFLDMLDEAREVAGIPFRITSGYRCPIHNKNVGSTSTNHVKGVASDITCTTSTDRIKIVKALIQTGFKRIGVYKNFVHADINDEVDAMWLG